MSTTKIHLTPREQQILAILRTTAPSNKLIARQLHITESGVKRHVSNLLRKLGAMNRSQLIVFAQGYTV